MADDNRSASEGDDNKDPRRSREGGGHSMDERSAEFRLNDAEEGTEEPPARAGGSRGNNNTSSRSSDGNNDNDTMELQEVPNNSSEEGVDAVSSGEEDGAAAPSSSDAPQAPVETGGGAAPPAATSVVSTRRGGTRGSTKAAAAAVHHAATSSTLVHDSSSSTVMDATTHAAFVQASAIVAHQGFRAVSALINSALASNVSGGNSIVAAGSAAVTAAAAASASGAGAGGAASNSNSSATLGGDNGDALVSALQSSLVENAAHKLVAESPPWVHWSRSDTAPQLKIAGGGLSKTTLLGSYRGYRMGRASAGLSSGNHYYEVVILPAPSAHEIYAQLPPSARLGPGLEAMLKLQQEQEDREQQLKEQQEMQSMGQSNHSSSSTPAAAHAETGKRIRVGGHIRLGWSMRTGELQAPVGYDKWSYAIRDIGGSLVHKSHRQDAWWSGYDSIEFGPGDVVGCALCLDPPSGGDEPHIRFFLNGECLGHFVISKGKRVGGVAFTIEPGCYYPAASLYMGGGVRANFGPHWIYPPKKLPTGFPKLQPVSASVAVPPRPSEALEACTKALKLVQALKRPDAYTRAVKAALEAEAKVRCDAYDRYYLSQLEFVHNEREHRGLSTNDLKEKLQQLRESQQQEQVVPT